MPPVTRWFIKSGMIYLLAALLGWVLLPAQPLLGLPVEVVALWRTILHLLVVGWLTQLIFGVAFWMFPRHSADTPRGSERLAWAAWWCLNLGLVLRILGEPRAALGAEAGLLLVLSAGLQLTAGCCFIVNTWPRVKLR